MRFFKRIVVGMIEIFLLVNLMGCQLFDVRTEQNGSSQESNQPEKQVSNAIPVYENNGGLFVKYNDAVYYREYTSTSHEKSALWGQYPYESNDKKMVKRRLQNGTTEELFEDAGFGKFYIIDDRFFGYNELFLYSTDLTGNDFQTWGAGVQYRQADENKHRLYCSDRYYGGIIYEIDTLTLEQSQVCDIVVDYFLRIKDNQMYYIKTDENRKNEIDVMKYDMTTKQKSLVATLSDNREEGMLDVDFFIPPCEPEDYVFVDNKMYITVGIRDGSAALFSNGNLYEVNLTTGEKEILASDIDSNLVLDGDNLYYMDLIYELGDTDYYHSINVRTKKDKVEDSDYIYDKAQTGIKICATEEPQLILTDQSEVKKIAYTLEDKAHAEEKYLSEVAEEERMIQVINADVVGQQVYYEVMISKRDPEADIGWRYGYRHVASEIYCYHMKTGERELLYSYEV